MVVLPALCVGLLAAHLAVAESEAEGKPAAEAPSPDAISPKYRAAVKSFLEIANSTAIGEQIAYMMADQTLAAIATTGAPITDPLREIVLEESLKEFEPVFGDIEYLTDLHAPLYKQHFSEQELRDLVAFYETPLGKKMTEALPQISQASGMALQEASFAMVPAFQAKLDARFQEAGIQVQP
jgi:hypothetical protein